MSKQMEVIVRDGDASGEVGQYVMQVAPQPGQPLEEALKASEIEIWAHNHGPRRHGAPVKGWFVMMPNGWRRIPFKTRCCECQRRDVARPPRYLVPDLLRAEGLSLAKRVDILY